MPAGMRFPMEQMRTNILRAVAAAIAFAVSIEVALAANINAPLDTRPTIGSEIRRGYSTALGCFIRHNMVSTFDDCILAAGAKAEQELSNSAPFLLGLNYGATDLAKTAFDVDAEMKRKTRSEFWEIRVRNDQRRLGDFYRVFKVEQKQVSISNADIANSFGPGTTDPKAARAEVLKELSFWDANPPAK